MKAIDAVRSRLGDLASVTALVSTRIFTLKFPQNVMELGDSIRLTQIVRPTILHLRGDLSLYRAVIQMDCAARETSGADPYANAVAIWRAAHGAFVNGAATGLSGWSGTTTDSPFIVVHGILPDAGPRERYDPDEVRMVVVSHDYVVWYYE